MVNSAETGTPSSGTTDVSGTPSTADSFDLVTTVAEGDAAHLMPGNDNFFPSTDDDESDDDEDEAGDDLTEDSTDTAAVAVVGDQGRRLFDLDICRVILSGTSRTGCLVCGHPRSECSRREHRSRLQALPDRVAPTGFYLTQWNTKKTTLDGVADSHTTVEDLERERRVNREALEQLTELRRHNVHGPDVSHADRQSRVSFGTTAQVAPRPTSTPRRDALRVYTDNMPALGTVQENIAPIDLTDDSPNLYSRQANELHLLTEQMASMSSVHTQLFTAQAELLNQLKALRSEFQSPTPAPTPPTPAKRLTFYGVSKGRTTGVLYHSKDVNKSISGYAGARAKRFRSEEAARRWLQEQMTNDETWEVGSDDTYVERCGPADTSYTRSAYGPRAPEATNEDRRGYPVDTLDLCAPIARGPDPSVGDKTRVYGTSINATPEVLDLLCPKGVTQGTKDALVEAAVDVTALPGKYGSRSSIDGTDSTTFSVVDSLARAVGEFAAVNAAQHGTSRIDLQWQAQNRNALSKVKTLEDLTATTDLVKSRREAVFSSMKGRMQNILFRVGWDLESAERYCEIGLLPRLVLTSLENYYGLYIHLLGSAHANPLLWTQITRIQVEYHAEQLGIIRDFAISRLDMFLGTYIYLRDSSRTGYSDIKLMNKLSAEISAHAFSSLLETTPGGPTNRGRTFSCAHCHDRGNHLHDGGRVDCPAHALGIFKARRVAAKAVLRMEAGEDDDGQGVRSNALESDISHYDHRVFQDAQRPIFTSYGTSGIGYDLAADAWTTIPQIFSSLPEHKVFRSPGPIPFPPIERLPKQFLSRHPVDLLVLGSLTPCKPKLWRSRIKVAPVAPRVVLEFWDPSWIFKETGPVAKHEVTEWDKAGYSTSCQMIHNLQVGGVVDTQWLVVARTTSADPSLWRWPALPKDQAVRPMENCLRPFNVPRSSYRPCDAPDSLPKAAADPMPPKAGTMIATSKGPRRLLNDELAKGLGVPSKWLRGIYPEGHVLGETVPVHIFEYLSAALSSSEEKPQASPSLRYRPKLRFESPPDLSPESSSFSWHPPDLSPGQAWHRTRVRNLLAACQQHPDPTALFEEGMTILRRHRCNYTSTHPDPKELQLLWWEFPYEHWPEIREGSPMCFLNDLPLEHTPNAEMDEEQLIIAEEFLEELVSLGVLVPDEIGEMMANGPLFCLIKPGQPGQWRVLSDMKRGGQNDAIGADPTVFPKAGVILDQMYTGGYNAVVDASKFFYQFRTAPSDRRYLGTIHPRDPSKHFLYAGLPMGAGSSPGLAGRYGAAFLRLLRDRFPIFQGTPSQNTWWGHYELGHKLHPHWGHGRILLGEDGEPAVLLFSHCDDFLIHSPSRAKCDRALRVFLDAAVDVGLLCHPGKIIPPSQTVKYTGLLFDSSGVPTIRIPESKRCKARAMIDYVGRHQEKVSRLVLAVVVGVLESLVEATPSRIGHTYLRHLQEDLHPPEWEGEDLPYFSFVALTPPALEDLDFWKWLLDLDVGRRARALRSGSLIPSFGDGSGTGTGGTVNYDEDSPLEMWMGTWNVCVLHHHSNWKEARTLLATLERAKLYPSRDIRDTTFFYFTDNLVTYYITTAGASRSPELHSLVRQIKRLEIALGIQLEVVHIPGTSMIEQGTDGLSRGVWMSALQARHSQQEILSTIFEPIPYLPQIGEWAQSLVPELAHCRITHQDWRMVWVPRRVLHHVTIWAPPPEVAPQLLHFLLQTYVEAPLTTACLVLVPCVLQRRWSRLSRFVYEVGRYQRDALPLPVLPILRIPFVLLYIPFHRRSLPAPWMEQTPASSLRRFHRKQATLVRGVPGTPLSG